MGFLNSWHIHLVASVRSLRQGQYPPVRLSPFSDGADNLLIGIEIDFHVRQLFLDCGFIIPQDKVLFCDEVTLIKKIRCFLSTGF